MNKKTYSNILDDVAKDQIPSHLDLAPTILARVQKGRNMRTLNSQRLITAALLVVTALAILFYTVPGMAAAVGRWFGYIPGAGLVREGQIRVLPEPVAVTRSGITVTVDQVVLDTERTALVYSVDDIPNEVIWLDSEEQCLEPALLRLPDGKLLSGPGSGAFGPSYQQRIDYPPIPAGIDDATLVIPCLFSVRRGAAPENWEIPLHFTAAPPEMTAFPVNVIPSPTATTVIAASQSPAAAAEPVVMTLTLDRAVQMNDGYLLYATLHWQDTPFSMVDIHDPSESLRLLDASGNEMRYEVQYNDQPGADVDQRQTSIVIKTAPVETQGPLTLALDSVTVNQSVTAGFVFDPGVNPQPGQTWPLDEEIKIGEQTLHVHAAKAGKSGYSFDMSSETGIQRVMLVDKDHQLMGGGGGGGGGNSNPQQFFSAGFNYANGLPEGPVTVSIIMLGANFTFEQPLKAEWTPPAESVTLLPTQPAACVTADAWKAALKQPSSLPAGLSGKVLVYGPPEGGSATGAWEIAITRLDGSERQVIAGATDGALSPDGTTLAFSTLENGLSIMDLSSGEVTPVSGTASGDFTPFWSPDGKQIVFMRGMGVFDLFIVDADGANMRQLTFGGVQETPAGWLPDGDLLYVIPGRENEFLVYRLDLQSGESQEYSQEYNQSISPDGKHVVNAEKAFGDRWVMSVSELDGSNRWALSSSDLWVLTPLWSPDGKWLLVGVSDTDSGSTTGAVVNLQTCQIIPLPGLKGSFLSWTP